MSNFQPPPEATWLPSIRSRWQPLFSEHRQHGSRRCFIGHSAPHPSPITAQPNAIFVMKEWILSPLEKTCLRWVSHGRTIAEIALLEGKNVAYIENCLESALVALKAKSIEEALQKADLGLSD